MWDFTAPREKWVRRQSREQALASWRAWRQRGGWEGWEISKTVFIGPNRALVELKSDPRLSGGPAYVLDRTRNGWRIVGVADHHP